MRYVCSVCGYVYDEEKEGKAWKDLPDDWKCPLCGAKKSEFKPEGGEKADEPQKTAASAAPAADMKELTAIEMSALCSNLARGCEKQYKMREAEEFTRLSVWFKSRAKKDEAPSFEKMLEMINGELERDYPSANAVSKARGDRGAQRSLVWGEKVTRILRSLLERYEEEGDKMLENTGVFVCTICGFVYLGKEPPERCPVCKVPAHKFEKMGGVEA
ncbi:MAG: rubredoxin [Clostridia bacterium]|nr:rubredoxin [Clostridia bacterium]